MPQRRWFSCIDLLSCFVTIVCVVAAALQAHAQNSWSTPVVITRDSVNEQHPVFASAYRSGNPVASEEYLAFVRNGRIICVRHTRNSATGWADTMYCVGSDSGYMSNPTMTMFPVRGTANTMFILAWQSDEYPMPGSNIMYTTMQNNVWGQIGPIRPDFQGDRTPHLAADDSGAGCVWERRGRIMFSRFIAGNWSMPEFVTPPGDTLNSSPKLAYDNRLPIVIWLKRKAPDTTYAIYCTTKRSGIWKQPDTIAYSGDNRQLSLFRNRVPGEITSFCWSRAHGTGRQVVATWSRYVSDTLQRGTIQPLSVLQEVGVNEWPAANNSPIPITTEHPLSSWHIAGAWQTTSASGNGITLSAWAGSSLQLVRPVSPVSYQRPEIGPGCWSYPYLRIWVVWEGVTGNARKLHGSYITIMLTDVTDNKQSPTGFTLEQNYPNPFNPTTTVKFQIAEVGGQKSEVSRVTLKVYDLLGREVATLVNEEKQAGWHEVQWDASDYSSGVYWYVLRAGDLVQARKLVVIR